MHFSKKINRNTLRHTQHPEMLCVAFLVKSTYTWIVGEPSKPTNAPFQMPTEDLNTVTNVYI